MLVMLCCVVQFKAWHGGPVWDDSCDASQAVRDQIRRPKFGQHCLCVMHSNAEEGGCFGQCHNEQLPLFIFCV